MAKSSKVDVVEIHDLIEELFGVALADGFIDAQFNSID